MGSRIVYLDIVKGVGIFLVVWFHAAWHPWWLTAALVNGLFFFLSGYMFSHKPFLVTLKGKIKTLLIPYFTFFLLSCILTCGYEFVAEGRGNVQWELIYDAYQLMHPGGFQPKANMALWFLPVLFYLNIVFSLLCKVMSRRYIALLLPVVFLGASYHQVFIYAGTFMAGYVLRGIMNRQNILTSGFRLLIGLGLVFGSFITISMMAPHGLFYRVLLCVIDAGMIITFSCIKDTWWICKPVAYLGTVSLGILCLHFPLIVKLNNFLLPHVTDDVWIGLMVTAVTIVFIIPIIELLKRYVPWMLGKFPSRRMVTA